MARKEVRTYVDDQLLDRWRKRHGSYASLSWLMETAMNEVLDLTDSNPSLSQAVETGIKSHVLKLQHRPNKPHAILTDA